MSYGQIENLILNELHPWGSATYILDSSHKYGKLGPRGKKCIFIRYSENSKGYVFIGEDSDGRITEIESRDVTFLEDHFPKKEDVDKGYHLYEVEEEGEVGTSQPRFDPQEKVPNSILDSGSTPELLHPSQLSGRVVEDESEPISISEDNNPQLRRSIRSKIPKRHFSIENEAYIVTPYDDEEPKSVKEALESPAKEK